MHLILPKMDNTVLNVKMSAKDRRTKLSVWLRLVRLTLWSWSKDIPTENITVSRCEGSRYQKASWLDWLWSVTLLLLEYLTWMDLSRLSVGLPVTVYPGIRPPLLIDTAPLLPPPRWLLRPGSVPILALPRLVSTIVFADWPHIYSSLTSANSSGACLLVGPLVGCDSNGVLSVELIGLSPLVERLFVDRA